MVETLGTAALLGMAEPQEVAGSVSPMSPERMGIEEQRLARDGEGQCTKDKAGAQTESRILDPYCVCVCLSWWAP